MPGSERQPVGWPGWPQGKTFALVLTHDVEGRAGLDKCLQLAELERKMGFRSSFNFVPEGNYRVSAELRNRLVHDGFEVGVHDLRHDGWLYQSRRNFSRRAVQINGYLEQWGASGFRSGFMLHNLDWLHELKIKYDMSTFDTDPFEPQPEGRHTIFPFLVPHPAPINGDPSTTNRGYVELPYTLPQDSTLFGLLRESTPDIWIRKLDWIAHNRGMVLLNTHPDYMSFDSRNRKAMEYPVQHYQRLLDHIATNYRTNCWRALPAQVAAHVMQVSKKHLAAPSPRNVSADNNLASVNQSAITLSLNGAESTLLLDEVGLPPVNIPNLANSRAVKSETRRRLLGKRGAVLLFSHYPADPRPRRAAEALISEGATIDLICLQEDAGEPKRETVNGVNVLRVPLKRRRRGKLSYGWQYSAFILLSFVYLALRSLRRRYDFVHVHNMPDVLVFSALIPKLLGAKVALDLHDPMPELMQAIFNLPEESANVRLLKQMEKQSIAFADCVLTVSVTFKKLFSSRSCVSNKITVVVNSPDERIFQFQKPRSHSGDRDKPFVILYHGSLLRRNGFDLAVDALEIVREVIPGAKLVVCGAPTPFLDYVMSSVRERGLQKSIEYLGSRNLEQIVEAIKACDVGVVPNHRNIFTELNTPTRIFECLALGKPAIVPRAQGIQDYFGNDDLIYFELGNASDLAARIKYAFFNPGEVEAIVRRGQQVYLKHRWSSEKENLLNAFVELIR